MIENNHKVLKKAGLKVTLPRLKILERLQQPDYQHINECRRFIQKIINEGEEISLTTVYRVLNQFDNANIVNRHHFSGEKSVFELEIRQHHDHLVCLDSGSVIEFSDTVIEQRLVEIAREHGIELTDYSLYLYGNSVGGNRKAPDIPKKKYTSSQ